MLSPLVAKHAGCHPQAAQGSSWLSPPDSPGLPLVVTPGSPGLPLGRAGLLHSGVSTRVRGGGGWTPSVASQALRGGGTLVATPRYSEAVASELMRQIASVARRHVTDGGRAPSLTPRPRDTPCQTGWRFWQPCCNAADCLGVTTSGLPPSSLDMPGRGRPWPLCGGNQRVAWASWG